MPIMVLWQYDILGIPFFYYYYTVGDGQMELNENEGIWQAQESLECKWVLSQVLGWRELLCKRPCVGGK
jgi:hypothetical protein